MASAFIGYSFGFIEPGATLSVYLHGFPFDQFAAIDVQPAISSARPGDFSPVIDVDSHTVAIHSDGTRAHIIQVTNRSTSNGALPSPVVNVAVLLQPLQ
jgi:hypothetical protein